jgi:hypothetical protein
MARVTSADRVFSRIETKTPWSEGVFLERATRFELATLKVSKVLTRPRRDRVLPGQRALPTTGPADVCRNLSTAYGPNMARDQVADRL